MAKTLITGDADFLGSHLIDRLLKDGIDGLFEFVY